MPRSTRQIPLALLALTLFSGCLDQGAVNEIKLRYSRNFTTYRPADGTKIQVQDEFKASSTLDGDCEATLEQTVLTDQEAQLERHELQCVPVADATGETNGTLELSLRDSQGNPQITYIFGISLELAPTLIAIRTADGIAHNSESGDREIPATATDSGLLPQQACGEISIDLARDRLTIRRPIEGSDPAEFQLPDHLSDFLRDSYKPDNNPETPWTGLASQDFLDIDAIGDQEGIRIVRSASNTTLGLPCPYNGVLRIDHSVRVLPTRRNLAPFLDPDSTQGWYLDYQEYSYIRLDSKISGSIVPVMDGSTLSWKLSGHSRVLTRGQYQLRKKQRENLDLNGERKSIETDISSEGSVEQELELQDLVESADIDSAGEVTLRLGSPPIEMEIHEVRKDLLTGVSQEEYRNRRIFFPGRYTRVGWPSNSFEFTRFSEPRLETRATIHDEVDLPALWTSDIRLHIVP